MEEALNAVAEAKMVDNRAATAVARLVAANFIVVVGIIGGQS